MCSMTSADAIDPVGQSWSIKFCVTICCVEVFVRSFLNSMMISPPVGPSKSGAILSFGEL
jgi:hypothetical protein